MGQKMESIGWGRNLQLGIQLFEPRLSPELFRTGAREIQIAAGKRLSNADEIYCFYMFLEHWSYRRGEKGGSRFQRQGTAVVEQELGVSSLELGQPCSRRAWAKDSQTSGVTNDRQGGGCSLDPSDLVVQPSPEGYRHPHSYWHLSRGCPAASSLELSPQRAKPGQQ